MDRERVETRMRELNLLKNGTPDWTRLAHEAHVAPRSMDNYRNGKPPGRLVRASIARVLQMSEDEIWPRGAATGGALGEQE